MLLMLVLLFYQLVSVLVLLFLLLVLLFLLLVHLLVMVYLHELIYTGVHCLGFRVLGFRCSRDSLAVLEASDLGLGFRA